MKKTTDSSRPRSRYRSLPVVLLAVALSGMVLAACGAAASSSSTATTTTPTTSSTSSSTAAFDSCLKKHGVTAPTGGRGAPPTGAPTGSIPSGGFTHDAKTSAAFKACSSLLPKGSKFGGGAGFGGGTGAASTAFAAYRNCMTLHGVKLPTRTAGSAPTSAGSTPTTSATYKKAEAACKALAPTTTTPNG